jgi:hypothetical protein
MADDTHTEQGGSAFDRLAAAMPKIAAAVKDLPEAVQGKAFDALVATFDNGGAATGSTEQTQRSRRKPAGRKPKATDEEGGTTRRKAAPTTINKDLNLSPGGKKSFATFVAEKKPTTQNDRSLVAIYWLSEIADQSPITVSDVFTCYKKTEGWKLPKNPANALAVTANRKGYFDTSDLQDIQLTPHGINRVNELPEKEKA